MWSLSFLLISIWLPTVSGTACPAVPAPIAGFTYAQQYMRGNYSYAANGTDHALGTASPGTDWRQEYSLDFAAFQSSTANCAADCMYQLQAYTTPQIRDSDCDWDYRTIMMRVDPVTGAAYDPTSAYTGYNAQLSTTPSTLYCARQEGFCGAVTPLYLYYNKNTSDYVTRGSTQPNGTEEDPNSVIANGGKPWCYLFQPPTTTSTTVSTTTVTTKSPTTVPIVIVPTVPTLIPPSTSSSTASTTTSSSTSSSSSTSPTTSTTTAKASTSSASTSTSPTTSTTGKDSTTTTSPITTSTSPTTTTTGKSSTTTTAPASTSTSPTTSTTTGKATTTSSSSSTITPTTSTTTASASTTTSTANPATSTTASSTSTNPSSTTTNPSSTSTTSSQTTSTTAYSGSSTTAASGSSSTTSSATTRITTTSPYVYSGTTDTSGTYEPGDTVFPNGTIVRTNGDTVYPNGTVVTSDGWTIKDGTKIAPNGTVYNPNGSQTYPNGTTLNSDGSTTYPNGTVVAAPKYANSGSGISLGWPLIILGVIVGAGLAICCIYCLTIQFIKSGARAVSPEYYHQYEPYRSDTDMTPPRVMQPAAAAPPPFS